MVQIDRGEIVPIRSIEEHVSFIRRKWKGLEQATEGIERAKEKAISARLELALELRALKQRIDDGENGELSTWWEFYDDIFQRSRGDAEKLLAIANAQDPQVAYEERKARDAANSRAYRQYSKSNLSVVSPQPEKPQGNQRPADAAIVSGTIVTAAFMQPIRRIPTATSRPRYTEGPDDDELVAQGMVIFKRLSWNGRVRLMKEQDEAYKRWHRGEE